MSNGEYKLPPDSEQARADREAARAAAEHAPLAKKAARRDRKRELLRHRPESLELTPVGLRRLRELADVEVGLIYEVRALNASSQEAVNHKHRCQQKCRELAPKLEQARADAARSHDPAYADRYAEAVARLEAEYQALVDDIAGTRERQDRLAEKARQKIAVATPLTQRIDRVCTMLRKSRTELNLAAVGRVS